MEFWNESLVTVTLGGEVPSADAFRRLVDAVETSGLDLVPLEIDTEKALIAAAASGRPIRLEAEDGDLGRISDFERAVHILGLECVITQKVPGATTVRTWFDGINRPTEFHLDGEGRALVDAETVSLLLREGADLVQSYIDQARGLGHGNVAALSASEGLIREIEADMEPALTPYPG